MLGSGKARRESEGFIFNNCTFWEKKCVPLVQQQMGSVQGVGAELSGANNEALGPWSPERGALCRTGGRMYVHSTFFII